MVAVAALLVVAAVAFALAWKVNERRWRDATLRQRLATSAEGNAVAVWKLAD